MFTARDGDESSRPAARALQKRLISEGHVPLYFMKRKIQKSANHRPKARAADVLSSNSPQVRVRPKWMKYYRRLIELRSYLLNRKDDLAKAAAEERPTFSMHMAD